MKIESHIQQTITVVYNLHDTIPSSPEKDIGRNDSSFTYYSKEQNLRKLLKFAILCSDILFVTQHDSV